MAIVKLLKAVMMKIVGQEQARQARFEANTFTMYQIDTMPDLSRRIAYAVYSDTIFDEYRYAGHEAGVVWWELYRDGESLGIEIHDDTRVGVKFNSYETEIDYKLRYTLGA